MNSPTDRVQIVSAFDRSPLRELELSGENTIHGILERATVAFREGELPKSRRIEILENFLALLKRDQEQLLSTAIAEGGKPRRDTVVEFQRACEGVRLGIHAFHEVHGEEVPMSLSKASAGRLAFTTLEPIGVVVSISAFNHPINLIIRQIVPPLVAGCPVIIKPDLRTPLSCVLLVDLLHEAGLPSEWCQVALCSNVVAEKLATDSRVSFLSFIGSARVGWHLRSQLAPGTRCSLELGGVAPVLIDEQVSLPEIVPPLLRGAFYHAGQVCVSVQKIYVPKAHFDEFAYLFVEGAKKLRVGDPNMEDTEVGPIIDSVQLHRIDTLVKASCSSGAELLCGGEVHMNTCYAPTVLRNPVPNCEIRRNEIFGPVVALIGYESRNDVYAEAHSLPYAFQASVFTNNYKVAFEALKNFPASALLVNDHTAFRVDWMPFGGARESGLGKGGIPQTVREMSHEKLAIFSGLV
ncbi:MAG: aldehyde dehydrogenase family protein [Bdellovibrionales bacterium]|nr:aldehyde dehydrogenase family protein [Bdellovibrionales bacterium]